MKLTSVELRQISMPLLTPFTTSFGTEDEKVALLVRVAGQLRTPSGEVEVTGWGECVAMAEPVYSAEYVSGAQDVMRRFLVPAFFAADEVSAKSCAALAAGVVGHPMAKAALEMAVLDAELTGRGVSLADHLGAQRNRVPSGVSVGIQPSVEALLDVVGAYLDQGYARIKLKIRPGHDLEPVRAVRDRFGDIPLQVDANAAYSLGDAATLRRLDEFALLLLEQPLAQDDLRQHAELARLMSTPICLDESITSARAAADAITLGATRVINIKPGRVGGYLEALRIHDLCLAHGVPVWCGGMLETGLGRAANAAFAALPGCTLTGDVSGSDRFYGRDLTEPVVMRDGWVEVPREPGLGRAPLADRLAEFTTAVLTLSR